MIGAFRVFYLTLESKLLIFTNTFFKFKIFMRWIWGERVCVSAWGNGAMISAAMARDPTTFACGPRGYLVTNLACQLKTIRNRLTCFLILVGLSRVEFARRDGYWQVNSKSRRRLTLTRIEAFIHLASLPIQICFIIISFLFNSHLQLVKYR